MLSLLFCVSRCGLSQACCPYGHAVILAVTVWCNEWQQNEFIFFVYVVALLCQWQDPRFLYMSRT